MPLTKYISLILFISIQITLVSLETPSSKSQCDTSTTLLLPSNHFSGYIQLPNKPDAHLFYMHIENRHQDPNAPLIYWTNGGPGQSSLIGLFRENGPYKIQDDLTLCWNEFGWDLHYNLLYIDQPIGVGFSYTSNESDYVTNETGVAKDVVNFFIEFFKLHPELNSKHLFLTGESYAG